MEAKRDKQQTGTLAQEGETNEQEGTKTEGRFISLAKIVKEMSQEKCVIGKEYKYHVDNSQIRNCSRAFVRNLTTLLGKDYSEHLKNGTTHYKIPIESKMFVRRLIEPDEKLLQIIQGKSVYEGIGVLETVDNDGIKNIVTKDTELSEIRFSIFILFGECESKVRDEVMQTFYAKYNPYYTEIKNGINKLKELFDKIVISPHMDTASSRALYDDVERCIQDIYYAEKRSTMLMLFNKDFAKSLRAIEYANRIQ